MVHFVSCIFYQRKNLHTTEDVNLHLPSRNSEVRENSRSPRGSMGLRDNSLPQAKDAGVRTAEPKRTRRREWISGSTDDTYSTWQLKFCTFTNSSQDMLSHYNTVLGTGSGHFSAKWMVNCEDSQDPEEEKISIGWDGNRDVSFFFGNTMWHAGF